MTPRDIEKIIEELHDRAVAFTAAHQEMHKATTNLIQASKRCDEVATTESITEDQDEAEKSFLEASEKVAQATQQLREKQKDWEDICARLKKLPDQILKQVGWKHPSAPRGMGTALQNRATGRDFSTRPDLSSSRCPILAR